MVKDAIRGRPVTEEQVQACADEAERGFPVDQLRKRGRPPLGDGPDEVIAVRMDEASLARLTAEAERERQPFGGDPGSCGGLDRCRIYGSSDQR
jgi:hypothetical protein